MTSPREPQSETPDTPVPEVADGDPRLVPVVLSVVGIIALAAIVWATLQ